MQCLWNASLSERSQHGSSFTSWHRSKATEYGAVAALTTLTPHFLLPTQVEPFARGDVCSSAQPPCKLHPSIRQEDRFSAAQMLRASVLTQTGCVSWGRAHCGRKRAVQAREVLPRDVPRPRDAPVDEGTAGDAPLPTRTTSGTKHSAMAPTTRLVLG